MEVTRFYRLAALLALAATPAFGQAPPLPAATELEAQVQRLTEQVERLQATVDENRPDNHASSDPIWSQPQPPFHVAAEPPAAAKPKVTYPTVKVTGFFQADAAWFTQDDLNRFTPVAGAPLGDVQDGADFRRTRLAAQGDVAANVGYMVEMDFAFPGRPSFMDVWAEVRDTIGPGTLRIGQFRHPFGMDALTSVREMPFLERALPFAFIPFRQIGASYYGHQEAADITWAASVFRFPTDTFGGNVGDDGGYGLATRWTWVPYTAAKDERLLHLGFNYSFGDPANDLVRYRNQPEVFVSETGGADQVPVGVPTNVPFFVDTGALPTQNFQLYGAELAGVLGALHYQSEATFAHVNRLDGDANDFWGAYAQVGYFLTGEVRPYNHKQGVLTRITPHNPLMPCTGIGAWEVVGRWSYIDLNDAAVLGNQLTDLTTGLNWYLNKNLKWQFMYTHAALDSPLVGESDAQIYSTRVQLDF